MKVSFNQPYENVSDHNGFGYAAKMCKRSLVSLGHEVGWRQGDADVEINFIQPQHWHWTGPYRIGYVPWESTGFPEGWIDMFNEVDEMWTPSPVIANLMVEAGTKVPVHVYEHGVESVWTPLQRTAPKHGRLQMLHVGGEALRKGANEVISAHMDSTDELNVQLVLKMMNPGWNVHDTDSIRLVKTRLAFEDLVALFHECHMMVYPSWGEGFGLNPLQAMATGMPTIITGGYAPYEDLLPEHLVVKSSLVESPWQVQHPGKMWKPDADDLKDKMSYLAQNYQDEADAAFVRSEAVRKRYDWDTITEKTFSKFM